MCVHVFTTCREEYEHLVRVFLLICEMQSLVSHSLRFIQQTTLNKQRTKALKLMKIANITTQYKNIYVIILQLVEDYR